MSQYEEKVADKKADYSDNQAHSYHHRISSDDEDALLKLQDKLIILENEGKKIKRVNQQYRQGGVDAITELSREETHKQLRIIEYSGLGTSFYPSYVLRNLNAQMRQVRMRILDLQDRVAGPTNPPIIGEVYRIVENRLEYRIYLQFKGKPDKSICTLLKKNGFRWTPSRCAWSRMLNHAGRQAVKMVLPALSQLANNQSKM